eukprot:162749_1
MKWKQIAFERGFFDESMKIDGVKVSMHGKLLHKATETEIEVRDENTSVLQMLRSCSDFRTEKSQIECIVEDELGCFIRMTPKCHPEIAGVGIEYAWGYAKLRFICQRRQINQSIRWTRRSSRGL